MLLACLASSRSSERPLLKGVSQGALEEDSQCAHICTHIYIHFPPYTYTKINVFLKIEK